MTESPPKIIQQIRFALSDLRSRNGHHDFEELCRHLARARIASNLFPATGPVAGTGDQGRDFESFATQLADELGPYGAFAAKVSEETLVCTCTLQADDIPGKIRSDAKKICETGTAVNRIHAFCSEDLVVGKRHALIEEICETHGVALEVWDGRALAEQLADPDTFWIAQEFLSLPADLVPQQPEGAGDLPEWYVGVRNKWRQSGGPRPLLADLLDLKSGLRYATFHAEARADLPFWIDLARTLTGDDIAPAVRQRARYEVGVATVRGLGHLRPADDVVRAYLADLDDEDDPARIEDTIILLSYSTSASAFGHSELELKDLGRHVGQLRTRVDSLLDSDPPPTMRLRLLELRGRLALMPDPAGFPEVSDAVEPREFVEMLDAPRDATIAPEMAAAYETSDLDVVMEAWSDLAASLEEAPLFPVDDFAALVNFLTPVLVDQPGWGPLVEALDSAVARTEGGAAAAARCRDRGMALLEEGRIRPALHELHRAKAEWWSGDTLRGALLAMLMISDCYRQLNLPLAAKQYALAVSGAAHTSGEDHVADLVAEGMLIAAEQSYVMGNWVAALEEVEIGLFALHALSEENDRSNEVFQRGMHTYVMCAWGARSLMPALVAKIDEIGRRIDLADSAEEVFADTKPWSPNRWREIADEQLLGRPFSDLGDQHIIRFAALGTEWTVKTPNEYAYVRAAERFSAAAQILLVEMAEEDLCLLPTHLEITVDLLEDDGGDGSQRAQAQPCNDGRIWTVRLTPSHSGTDPDPIFRELLTILSAIFLDVSLLPTNEYFDAVTRAFERGLGHKLAAGRPYDEMAEIVPAKRWEESGRISHTPPFDPESGPVPQHSELAWQSGPGPTYSAEKGQEMAANRYEMISRLAPYTLKRLGSDKGFAKVSSGLRERGWLDWHLLTAIYNIVANIRMAQAGLNTREGIEKAGGPDAVKELAHTPETAEDPVISAETFTTRAMEWGREAGLDPLVVHWGLQARQQTPDTPAIQRVLAARYRYWLDDADHPEFFPSSPDQSDAA